MKKILITLMSLAVLSVGAYAGDTYLSAKYVKGDFEMADAEWDFNGVEIAVGKQYPIPALYGALRAELAAGYTGESKPSDSWVSVESFSFVLNAYYDLNLNVDETSFLSRVHPYVGFGLGLKQVNADGSYEDAFDKASMESDDANFGTHFMLGVSVDLTKNLALDFGYRKSKYGDALMTELDLVTSAYSESTFKISSSEYTVGIRYTF